MLETSLGLLALLIVVNCDVYWISTSSANVLLFINGFAILLSITNLIMLCSSTKWFTSQNGPKEIWYFWGHFLHFAIFFHQF